MASKTDYISCVMIETHAGMKQKQSTAVGRDKNIVVKMIWMVQYDSRGRKAYIPSSAQKDCRCQQFCSKVLGDKKNCLLYEIAIAR
jgi:hypothetical protein